MSPSAPPPALVVLGLGFRKALTGCVSKELPMPLDETIHAVDTPRSSVQSDWQSPGGDDLEYPRSPIRADAELVPATLEVCTPWRKRSLPPLWCA